MSIRGFITPHLTRVLLSDTRMLRARSRAEAARRRDGRPHHIRFFHQLDDPYSHLLAQALCAFERRYEVELELHLVPPPEDWAAPERDMLRRYSRLDSRRLAAVSGLRFSADAQPEPDRVGLALEAVDAQRGRQPDMAEVVRWGDWLWHGEGDAPPSVGAASAQVAAAMDEAAALRTRLGHYLGATLFYEGEWTWGIDRLHLLEERLRALGAQLSDAPSAMVFSPPDLRFEPTPEVPVGERELHFYLSFRSPYTAISMGRVERLAEAYGAELRLRYVLPMVMRGLPVGPEKGRYILRDAYREARRLGVPFGPLSDPVGKPVERGYSLLPWAVSEGRGPAYCRAFFELVWSQGVNAGTNRGLRRIVEAADLSWSDARQHLGSDAWRQEAEANRQELTELGLWGVPSFRVGDVSAWGQDRLWVIEAALRGERSVARA